MAEALEGWERIHKAMEDIVTTYWQVYYATTHCTLCGNRGVLDTTGVCAPDGQPVGRRNWCICPNGQALRHASGTDEAPA